MNTNQAKKEGAAAFKAGKGCAPALNQAFLSEAVKAGNLNVLMAAYKRGWTVALLADGITDKSMPSVVELAEIEAA